MPFRNLKNCDHSVPVGVGVDITEVCNRNCPTCFLARSLRSMSWKLYCRIVDEALAAGFTEHYILGGEPTLHPEILDFLAYSADRFEHLILVTNMDRLADRDFCARVAETGVSVAGQRHTLDCGTEAERIEEVLSGDSRWLKTSNQAWDNVAELFAPEKVIVQCCITRPVVEGGSIFDVFRWTRQQGYEPVMEFTKEGEEFKRNDALDVSPSELFQVLTEFQRIDSEEFGNTEVTLICPQAYGKTCHMTENSIHFRVDGTAIPCVGHPDISCGHILNDDMPSILNHSLRRIFQHPEEWIYGYCRDECPYFKECTGGCRGSAYEMTGCPRASFYYCPHMPRDRLTLANMIPPTCEGCPLENHPGCGPKV